MSIGIRVVVPPSVRYCKRVATHKERARVREEREAGHASDGATATTARIGRETELRHWWYYYYMPIAPHEMRILGIDKSLKPHVSSPHGYLTRNVQAMMGIGCWQHWVPDLIGPSRMMGSLRHLRSSSTKQIPSADSR